MYSAKLIAKTLGSTMGFETSEETGITMSVTLPLAKFAPPTVPISSEEASFMARMHRCL